MEQRHGAYNQPFRAYPSRGCGKGVDSRPAQGESPRAVGERQENGPASAKRYDIAKQEEEVGRISNCGPGNNARPRARSFPLPAFRQTGWPVGISKWFGLFRYSSVQCSIFAIHLFPGAWLPPAHFVLRRTSPPAPLAPWPTLRRTGSERAPHRKLSYRSHTVNSTKTSS